MEVEYLEALLLKRQRESNISRILQIKSEPAVPGGENYLSAIIRVTADVILGSGAKRTISVIIKNAAQSGPTRDLMAGLGVFECEAKVYSHILRGMQELMYEFEDKRGPLWCYMYDHQPNMIVFEDLKHSGFKVANRHDCLDLQHSKLVVRSLARFHAMSKILLKRKYFSPDDLKPYPLIGNITFAEKVYGNGLRVLAREMRTWEPEWKDISDRIEKYGDVVAQKMLELSKVDESKFNVMNHGDCWICNLMFKYEPFENFPIEMRMVDLQFCHYQSFAWDLTYFLYTSLHGDLRRKYFDQFLYDYAKSLRDTLLFYQYPEEDIPNFDYVKQEMIRVQDLSVPFGLITHPLLTAPVKNGYNLDEGLVAGELLENNCGFNLDMFGSDYRKEVEIDIKRFVKAGII